MKHLASPEFWACLHSLPKPVQDLAKENIKLLKANPHHPSLHLKKVGKYRSFRVGLHYRALGTKCETGVLWFWIGHHAEYDRITS